MFDVGDVLVEETPTEIAFERIDFKYRTIIRLFSHFPQISL